MFIGAYNADNSNIPSSSTSVRPKTSNNGGAIKRAQNGAIDMSSIEQSEVQVGAQLTADSASILRSSTAQPNSSRISTDTHQTSAGNNIAVSSLPNSLRPKTHHVQIHSSGDSGRTFDSVYLAGNIKSGILVILMHLLLVSYFCFGA